MPCESGLSSNNKLRLQYGPGSHYRAQWKIRNQEEFHQKLPGNGSMIVPASCRIPVILSFQAHMPTWFHFANLDFFQNHWDRVIAWLGKVRLRSRVSWAILEELVDGGTSILFGTYIMRYVTLLTKKSLNNVARHAGVYSIWFCHRGKAYNSLRRVVLSLLDSRAWNAAFGNRYAPVINFAVWKIEQIIGSYLHLGDLGIREITNTYEGHSQRCSQILKTMRWSWNSSQSSKTSQV